MQPIKDHPGTSTNTQLRHVIASGSIDIPFFIDGKSLSELKKLHGKGRNKKKRKKGNRHRSPKR